MQVNICHRLIKQEIEKGTCYYFTMHSGLPLGVYATQNYKAGEIIRVLHGDLRLNPTRGSIHIGNNMHIIDEYGRYINYSFEPNVDIVSNKLIAIRDIKKFEEITFILKLK